MRSPQAPKLYQQNVFRSLKDFSDIVYFIVQVVFKTKHTEEQSLEADWLCVHRNTNTTRHVLVGLLWDSYKELESQNQVVILWSSRKIDFFYIQMQFKYFPFSSRSSKTNFGSTKGGKKKEKRKNKERNKHNKIHISIKGQHKVKGESSSIREAEETGIWTMYLTPHRHALGTTMNKRQESRKKNKPERGRSTELHRAIHPNRERTGHSLCAALKWGGREGAGVGNDRDFCTC